MTTGEGLVAGEVGLEQVPAFAGMTTTVEA